MDTMRVLKITAEGITTSFRYPHFMHGIHPTFEMPPPATIYGHICSALGEWVNPAGIQFAYHFTHDGEFDDVEHIHVVSASVGKLPGTQLPKVLEGAINPFKRKMLFRPRLTLYINCLEWASAFRSPYFPVVLGRSQDLMSYTNIEIVDLYQHSEAYFEHTLAPYAVHRHTASGYAVLMPRYLDYANKRVPSFAQYVVLNRRITQLFKFIGTDDPPIFWVDPTSAEVGRAHLGLWFHSFVDSHESGIT